MKRRVRYGRDVWVPLLAGYAAMVLAVVVVVVWGVARPALLAGLVVLVCAAPMLATARRRLRETRRHARNQ